MSKGHSPSLINKFTHLPHGIITFIKEAKEELKKVTWPNRQTTFRYTIIIIVASILTGVAIGGIDFIFQKVLENII